VRAVESTLASVAPLSQSGGAGVHVVDDGFRLMTAKRRFNANLMMAFAIFAMFIGAAGIYAVMASIVAQQTKEIGVRIALGATPGDIRRGVLIAAGRHLLIGLGVGLPAAWLMSRGFSAMFFQVTPTDLSTYVIVAVLLSAVSAIGAVVPARRASRVDPIISLRAS
jgi:ABC-type antimicrobial peptide transport system permease subunit